MKNDIDVKSGMVSDVKLARPAQYPTRPTFMVGRGLGPARAWTVRVVPIGATCCKGKAMKKK